ncbi:hypothetical protein HY251_16495 [bacterium]|nr:hypothetical protein [bacterium]
MTEASPPAKKPRKGPSLRARLAFSVGLVVAVLASLEALARIAGAGDPTAFGGSRLQYQQIYPPLFRVDERRPDRARPRDPRLVDRSFSLRAPPGRVFVFGESAAFGLGLSENASFSRALERDLRALGSPLEVVNVGIVALDSRQVRFCVEECAKAYRPEWVVLHVGNNEFLELHALRFLEATGKKPFAVSLDENLRRSRLYLALKNMSIEARNRELTAQTFSTAALRLSERQLVETKGVLVSREERASGERRRTSRRRGSGSRPPSIATRTCGAACRP